MWHVSVVTWHHGEHESINSKENACIAGHSHSLAEDALSSGGCLILTARGADRAPAPAHGRHQLAPGRGAARTPGRAPSPNRRARVPLPPRICTKSPTTVPHLHVCEYSPRRPHPTTPPRPLIAAVSSPTLPRPVSSRPRLCPTPPRTSACFTLESCRLGYSERHHGYQNGGCWALRARTFEHCCCGRDFYQRAGRVD